MTLTFSMSDPCLDNPAHHYFPSAAPLPALPCPAPGIINFLFCLRLRLTFVSFSCGSCSLRFSFSTTWGGGEHLVTASIDCFSIAFLCSWAMYMVSLTTENILVTVTVVYGFPGSQFSKTYTSNVFLPMNAHLCKTNAPFISCPGIL